MYVFVAIDVTGVPFPTTSSLKENENITAYERKCSQPTLFLLIVNFTKLVLDFKSVLIGQLNHGYFKHGLFEEVEKPILVLCISGDNFLTHS